MIDPPLKHLLTVARTYWRTDRAYDGSPEHISLVEKWEQELEKLSDWWAFLDELKRELPEFTLGNATATPDACFRCVAYSPPRHPPDPYRFIVVGCVSILAPVYTVYGVEYEQGDAQRRHLRVVYEPLPSSMRHPADIIARRIEATFGVAALPREAAETPVPLHVEPMEPPRTTLFHALFTSEPASLP